MTSKPTRVSWSLIGCPIHSALYHIEAKNFVNYYIYVYVCGCVCSIIFVCFIMVIAVRNRIVEPSSNQGCGCLPSPLRALMLFGSRWRTYLFPFTAALGEIEGYIGLSSLVRVNGLGERKLKIQTSCPLFKIWSFCNIYK